LYEPAPAFAAFDEAPMLAATRRNRKRIRNV
jgi:hypothetical protein